MLFAEETQAVWQNYSCPALLFLAVIMICRAMRDIRSSMDSLKDAINRMPPPAVPPPAPPSKN